MTSQRASRAGPRVLRGLVAGLALTPRVSRMTRRGFGRVLLGTALLAASPAEASDFRGFLSGVITFALVLPVGLVNLVLVGVFAMMGLYQSQRLARWHAGLAAIPPGLGMLATAIDAATIRDEGLRFLVNGVALALALLPLALARKAPPE